MDNNFKKLCACGALAIVIYSSTPLCKKCLQEKHIDLPKEDYTTTTQFSTQSISVSGIYRSAITTQLSIGLLTDRN